jgi:hypothetical protein
MEQAHQPATNNHINRYERLGTCRSIIPGVGIIPECAVLVENVVTRPLCENLSRDIAIASMPGRTFSKSVSQFYRAAMDYDWG